MILQPTRKVLRQLLEHGEEWWRVEADLQHPETVTPVPDSDTRLRLAGEDYMGYVEPGEMDGERVLVLVGVRPRERAAVAPGEAVVGVGSTRPGRRRSGGRGRVWPTTWDELVKRIRATPGAVVVEGAKHLVVYLNGQQVDALPKTASDHRSLLNACLNLRRQGIDVAR